MRGLWPLPGSRVEWDASLADLMKMAQDGPCRSDYIERVRDHFPRVDSTGEKYLILLVALGFLEAKQGQVFTSARGRAVLTGDLPGTVRRVLLDRVEGVTQVLEAVAQGPLRVGLIHLAVSPEFGWERQSQIRYRVQWMQLGELLAPVPARYPAYGITSAGRRELTRARKRVDAP